MDYSKDEQITVGPVRTLVIEDNTDYAQLVERKLNRAKNATFEIVCAGSLSEGFRQLETRDFDLVLLDLNLPDSEEIDTFVKLHHRFPKLPIIILTANEDETLALKCIQLGAEAYLVKNEIMSANLARSVLHSYRRFMISRKKQTEILRDGEENYFRNALDSNADGIVIVNSDGIVLYVNPAAEHLFGRNEKELIGSDLGFPLVTGEKTEVSIVHKSGFDVVVEMRLVLIEWLGESAYLASLRDVTDRKKAEEELYNLSITDDLTGLHNRRGFFGRAERYHQTIKRKNKGFLIVFIDLDGLKQINDTYGHLIGSQALIDTAEVLRETFRDSDIMARFGGDEFVVLAKGISKENADLVRARLQEGVQSFNRNERRPYTLSISVGIAHNESGASIEELVNSADKLMYQDKQNKKTRSSLRYSSEA